MLSSILILKTKDLNDFDYFLEHWKSEEKWGSPRKKSLKKKIIGHKKHIQEDGHVLYVHQHHLMSNEKYSLTPVYVAGVTKTLKKTTN